jgi:type IV secretory pathway VirJ component
MNCRLLILILVLLCPISSHAAETTLEFGRFGKVALYQSVHQPSQVALFVSGDGGWNLGVVDMAIELSGLDVLVVGIDINRYFKSLRNSKEVCSYPAAEFEALSKYIQKKLNFPRYKVPVLVGYSSGATLVYAILAQAPPNTFSGAISMGFCPDLPLGKPLCKGNGLEWKSGSKGKGLYFLPFNRYPLPWIALQGTIDQVCDPALTESYVKQVMGGNIVMLPKVGHGFSVTKNWMPQFKNAFLNLVSRYNTGVASTSVSQSLVDLPLVEVTRQGTGSDILAVIISGDGGWAGIDRDIAGALSRKGLDVVGLNSLQYFWTRRTPEEASRDLDRILRHYLIQWKKKRIILIGYSFGADVLPFMINRLSPPLLDRIELIVLMGLDEKIDFEFHLTDWISGSTDTNALPVLPEVKKLKGKKLLCLRGSEESDSLCRRLDSTLAKHVILQGGHHFGGDYEGISRIILNELPKSRQ